MTQIKSKQLLLNSLSDEFQILIMSQTEQLVKRINKRFEEVLPDIITRVKTKARQINDEFKALPSKYFEEKFSAALERVLSQEINVLNHEGLDLLEEGYATIVGSFNGKAMDTARYISGMVMEFFNVEYPIITKTYLVSERNDNYIRFTLYKENSSWVHLLPKAKANEKIFERLMRKSMTNIDENKTRIISNYRYKMRESLRGLTSEFAIDISNMMVELNELMTNIEQGRKVQGEELTQVEEKYMLLIHQLDELSENKR